MILINISCEKLQIFNHACVYGKAHVDLINDPIPEYKTYISFSLSAMYSYLILQYHAIHTLSFFLEKYIVIL